MWLDGVHIPEYSQGTWTNHAARRKRKLLLHRERDRQARRRRPREKGHTIVPLPLYFKDGRAKVEIALARGKKEYDKRQTLRERQDRREADRAIAAANARARMTPGGTRGGAEAVVTCGRSRPGHPDVDGDL